MTSPDKTLRDSETPRCDVLLNDETDKELQIAVDELAALAKTLERELNAANARVKQLEYACAHADLAVKGLEAKLATARDDIKRMQSRHIITATRDLALEEAANACDVQGIRWSGLRLTEVARRAEADFCAQIIRSLKSSSGG